MSIMSNGLRLTSLSTDFCFFAMEAREGEENDNT
jgi:hypothetical protein